MTRTLRSLLIIARGYRAYKVMQMDSNRILLVNFGGIGDILLSLPAVRALQYGFNCNVDIFIMSWVSDFCRGLDIFGSVY